VTTAIYTDIGTDGMLPGKPGRLPRSREDRRARRDRFRRHHLWRELEALREMKV
jgi:hypothetical protein